MSTNEVGNRVYLYGLDGDNRIVRYGYIKNLSIAGLMAQANCLQAAYPAIEKVFAVDNSYDLYQAAQDAIRKGSMEDHVVLKIMLETSGMQVL